MCVANFISCWLFSLDYEKRKRYLTSEEETAILPIGRTASLKTVSMHKMNMEEDCSKDDFLNLAWIGLNSIKKDVLFEILNVKVDKTINWKAGYEVILNSFDEKVFLNFKIDEWEFVIGKYFFIDNDALKNITNRLSEKSKEVNSFAIDVWSNYYCYAKSVNGKNIRFWNKSDEGIMEEGILTNEEKEIEEKEAANKIIELADKITIPFQQIEKRLRTGKVEILK